MGEREERESVCVWKKKKKISMVAQRTRSRVVVGRISRLVSGSRGKEEKGTYFMYERFDSRS